MKRLIKESIYAMARIGLNTQKDTILVYVNPTKGGNVRYIKVYDNTSVESSEHLIRLSFDGNIGYDHRDGPPLWEPSKVPFKTLNSWMNSSSKKYQGLSNWQAAIYDWNYELGFEMSVDEFLNNEIEAFEGERQFVRPDTTMPQWDSSISIRRLG